MSLFLLEICSVNLLSHHTMNEIQNISVLNPFGGMKYRERTRQNEWSDEELEKPLKSTGDIREMRTCIPASDKRHIESSSYFTFYSLSKKIDLREKRSHDLVLA